METTLSLRLPPSFPSPPTQTLTLTLTLTLTRTPTLHRRRLPSIRSAISRSTKQQTVDSVKNQLENCHLIAGLNFKGFTVKQFQELRDSLPDSVRLLVAKNTLVAKAIEGTPWELLRPCMKGMNAWFFVHTEEIPMALKPYRRFQREKKLEENEFVGGVFEGRFYGAEEFRVLEAMPSRVEIYGKLLGSMRSPAGGVVGTLRAPAMEIVMLLKAYVRRIEEESVGA